MGAPVRRRFARWIVAAVACCAGARPSVGADDPHVADEALEADAAVERASVLNRQVLALYAERKFREATPLARRTLALRERVLGAAHADVATSLNNLGLVLREQAVYAEARPLLERALAIRERAFGPDHPLVANSLESVASVVRAQGAYGEARALYERTLAIREALGPPGSRDIATALNNLGAVMHGQGDYAAARRAFERVVEMREQLDGPDHPELALVLGNLAQVLQDLGLRREAMPLVERAQSIFEQVHGPDHPSVARALESLASLHVAAGDLRAARPALERALAIRERSLGPEHPDVAASLHRLADLLNSEGSPSEARRLYDRALAIRVKVFGEEHPHVATSLHCVALLLGAQGAHREAQPLLERALAIRERALGPSHVLVAESLLSLGRHRHDVGDWDEARALIRRAVESSERTLGPEHPTVSLGVNVLASVLNMQGRHAEALTLYERALALREASLGPDHPMVARSLHNLALAFDWQSDGARARPLLERALAVREKAYGPDHLDVASTLTRLGSVLAEAGGVEHGRAHLLRALSIVERHIRQTVAGTSSASRLDLARVLRWHLDVWLTVAPKVHRTGYDEVLRFKGLVARAERAERQLLHVATPAQRARIERLVAAERRAARLGGEVPPRWEGEARQRWQAQLADALAERERLATALAVEVAPFRRSIERLDLDLPALQAALDPDEALLDVLRTGDRYLAWVVRNQGAPTRLDLGPADAIDAAVDGLLAAASDAATDVEAGATAARLVRDLVLGPAADALGRGVRTLTVSPDAGLAAVPFAALPGREKGKVLAEDVRVRLVAFASDRVPDRDRPSPGAEALLVGGVDFERATSRATPTDVPASPSSGGTRFAALPGTLREVEAIHRRLGPTTTTLSGREATEARLRALVPGRRIVHLATHGFVRDDVPSALAPATGAESRWLGADLERQLTGWDPALLAGLALAGANAREGGEGDDGVLTALEATSLDLRQADLVVLSACQTAVGRAEPGEGVLGLVHALRAAGARHVVASLWKVDDEATRQLMDRFYAHLTDGDAPRSPSDALRAAALWLRAQPRFSAPYYWAAFVAYDS